MLVLGGFALADPIFGQIDRDGSGLSDVWEAAHGGGLVAGDDTDGDGFSNRTEDLAGTNPRDAVSFPRVDQLEMTGDGDLSATWFSVAGKRYQLESSRDMVTWKPLGSPFLGDGRVHAMVLPAETTFASGVTLQRWNGLTTEGLVELKAYAESGNPAPSESMTLQSLDIPQSNPNASDFGQWIHGWIVPPTTGDYVFWLASDDSSALFLSPDADPANSQLVASVSGWTSYQDWTKYGSQMSSPIPLVEKTPYYFEVFQREWAGGDHLSVAWSGTAVGSATPVIISGPALSSSDESLASQLADGRLFFRLKVGDVDSDRDGASDYEERLLGFDTMLATTTPRVNDRDAILGMLAAENIVTIGNSVSRAYETGGTPGRFVVFRSGNINPLTVSYTLSGTAVPGADYVPLTGSVSFGVGQKEVGVDIHAVPDAEVESSETVVLTMQSGPGFQLGAVASATVTIDDSPDVLYVANLRQPAEIRSNGSGSAAINRAGNSLFAMISLSYGNLSGDATGVDFYVSNDGAAGPVVLGLPAGQVPAQRWEFEAAGGLTREEILAALGEGRIWARVRSSEEPDGEILGQLTAGFGWQEMPDPPVPGPAPVLPANNGEASRFLAQATFGPRTADILELASGTYAGWIDAQLALPPTLHLPYVQARREELYERDGADGWQGPRQEAWWQAALTAPDQLRQRMAFALSQIFVISQFGALDSDHEGTTNYYDILLTHAFGNYRDLLREVTLSPMMGTYLSMIRNQKPDRETGHEPDENYARESMQLLSIGLKMLHPDGSLQLDANGLPIPTYTQDDVVGLAHIFTGWGPHFDVNDPPRWSDGNLANMTDWFRWGWDAMRPMTFYAEYHDTEPRTIAGGTVIPNTLSGEQRLEMALETLFQHPNTGPFVAKQLIQRFVTANPSPGYIFRVASIFANNGSGVRGDLGATIKAVLLDPEARSIVGLGDAGYGKPMEPLLRASRMLRAFFPNPGKQGDERFFLNFQYSLSEQAPLLAPSVFNFFQPGYVHPGRIAAAGLLSPEFQILAETTVINQANFHFAALYWDIWTGEPLDADNNVTLAADFSEQLALLNTPGISAAEAQELLIDHLDTLLLGGRMTEPLKQGLRDAFANLPGWFDYREERQISRVQMAAYLIMTSPEFFHQH